MKNSKYLKHTLIFEVYKVKFEWNLSNGAIKQYLSSQCCRIQQYSRDFLPNKWQVINFPRLETRQLTIYTINVWELSNTALFSKAMLEFWNGINKKKENVTQNISPSSVLLTCSHFSWSKRIDSLRNTLLAVLAT